MRYRYHNQPIPDERVKIATTTIFGMYVFDFVLKNVANQRFSLIETDMKISKNSALVSVNGSGNRDVSSLPLLLKNRFRTL